VPDGAQRRVLDLRLTLSIIALAAGVVGVVFGLVYWFAVTQPREEMNEDLEEEVARLQLFYEREGLDRLVEEIRRSADIDPGENYYLLEEGAGETLIGNLPDWPEDLPLDDKVHSIAVSVEAGVGSGQALLDDLPDWSEGAPAEAEHALSLSVAPPQGEGVFPTVHHVRAWGLMLPGDRHLLVGRDVTEENLFAERLRFALVVGAAVALLIGISGGLFLGRNLLTRVNEMNETVLRILRGRTDERVPVSGRRDEFEALAQHFNRMLDENDRLISRVREITNDIAHDLRTPLARLRRYVESVLALPLSEEEKRETLERVLSEADSILETFNALLSIAQIESGTIREEMEELELGEILRDAVELYEPLAEEEGIHFALHIEPDVCVRGNRHLLAQSVTNLIDNAIKYASGSKQIEISVARNGEGSSFSVRDFGTGIPEAERENVLERFVRLDTSRSKPGTGLGLSFVAAVAELHGARLELDDAHPGLLVCLRFSSSA